VHSPEKAKPLEPSEIHRLRAAEGWLELGNAAEAAAELENIATELREHPAVLEMRWEIFAKELKWDEAREIARRIVAQLPNHAGGWLHLSYATRRATGGSVQAAWEVLFPVAKKFPSVPLVSYNLACYACLLGRPEDGRQWLRIAFAAGDAARFKLMAIQDSDLKPLWKEIPEM
jgi:predicted Zn-dependent protease